MHNTNTNKRLSDDSVYTIRIGDSYKFYAGPYSADVSVYTGYDSYMKLVDDIDDPQTTINVTGSVVDSSTWLFSLSKTDTSVNVANYHVQCWLDDGVDIHTYVFSQWPFVKTPRNA